MNNNVKTLDEITEEYLRKRKELMDKQKSLIDQLLKTVEDTNAGIIALGKLMVDDYRKS